MIILSITLFILTGVVLLLLIFTNVFGNKSTADFHHPVLSPMPLTAHPEVRTQDHAEVNNREKGYQFEQFVVSHVSDKVFELVSWRSDKSTGNHFPSDNLKPDLHFRFRELHGPDLIIECKWRKNLPRHTEFTWTNHGQLQRYKKFAKSTDGVIYLVLGTGGEAHQPAEIYIIPFAHLTSVTIPSALLQQSLRLKKVESPFFFNPATGILS